MAIVTTFADPGSDATQDLSLYASSVGTAASATDQFNTGTSSIKLSNGAGQALASVNTPTGVVLDSGSQISRYVRFDTLPTGGNIPTFINIQNSGATGIFKLGINSSGQITQNPVGATGATGTKVIAVNTWYRICISYFITNTTTYQFKVYIQAPTDLVGVLDSTTNAGTLTNVTTTQVSFQCQTTLPANSNVWFDDCYIATGGASSGSQPDTGNTLVTAKRPFANGTTNGFTGSGTPSGYGTGNARYVNERPLNTSNFVSVVGAGSAITEEYNIENRVTGDANLTDAVLVDAVGWVHAKALTTETASIIVNNATSNISLTTTITMFTKAAGSTSYAAGTGTDIGIITSTTVTTVSLYECGWIIVYTLSIVPRIMLHRQQLDA